MACLDKAAEKQPESIDAESEIARCEKRHSLPLPRESIDAESEIASCEKRHSLRLPRTYLMFTDAAYLLEGDDQGLAVSL